MPAKRPLQAHKWWNSKVTMMLAVVYYQLGIARATLPLGTALLDIALFLLATAGIAGYGHLLNDLVDIEQDRRVDVYNLVAERTRRETIALFSFVLVLSWLPWLWLPTSSVIWGLLALEYILLTIYSWPPIRLKGRGWLGAGADALYGYSIPLTVSLLVFAQVGHAATPLWFVVLLAVWAFAVGARHILTHQLQHAAHDLTSGVQTFVATNGWADSVRLLDRGVLPVEATLFLILLIAIGRRVPLILIGFGAYMVWASAEHQARQLSPIRNPWHLPVLDRLFTLNVTIMSRFHTQWLPVLLLAALAGMHPAYLLLAAVHLTLFSNALGTLVRYDLPELRRVGRAA